MSIRYGTDDPRCSLVTDDAWRRRAMVLTGAAAYVRYRARFGMRSSSIEATCVGELTLGSLGRQRSPDDGVRRQGFGLELRRWR